MKITLPVGETYASLAARCGGVHPASMARALNDFDPKTGVHVCGAPLAISIHHETKGSVPCWALRPDLWREGQIPPHPLASKMSRFWQDIEERTAPSKEKTPVRARA